MLIFLRFNIIVITSTGKAREGFGTSCPEKKLGDTEGERPWEELWDNVLPWTLRFPT